MNDKYHDGFENSIMMSPDDTVMKNEILRKIKFEKMKKAKLSNFVRIERERIMSRRTSTNVTIVDEVKKTTTSQRSDSYGDSIESSPKDKPSVTVPSPKGKLNRLSKEVGSFEEGN